VMGVVGEAGGGAMGCLGEVAFCLCEEGRGLVCVVLWTGMCEWDAGWWTYFGIVRLLGRCSWALGMLCAIIVGFPASRAVGESE
jgi:hypothetical protein